MAVFAVDTPRAYEANPGLVQFRSAQPVDALEVRVDGRRYRLVGFERPLRRGTVGPIGLPSRDLTVTVVGWRDGRKIGAVTARNVTGLPRASMDVRRVNQTAPKAQVRMRVMEKPRTAAAGWIANLATGRGASYNAAAQFTAASTVKLPILITALMRTKADLPDTPLWGPVQQMVRSSSNDAANEVLTMIGGSTAAGGAMATRVARSLGATRTDVAAGYLPGQDRRAPPNAVADQPELPCCKHTTAHDMGVLMQAVVEAAAGRGKARRMGLTGRDARVALWLLSHTSDRGLIDPWTPWVTAHKIGYVDRAWHDVGAVFTPQGPLIVSVLTDSPGGASEAAASAYGRRLLALARSGLNAPKTLATPDAEPEPPTVPDPLDTFRP
jgi:beta-lactamase class A